MQCLAVMPYRCVNTILCIETSIRSSVRHVNEHYLHREDPAREEADGRIEDGVMNEAASAAPSAPVVSATSVVCFHKE